MITISSDVLALLACPVPDCRGPLTQEAQRLRCCGCGRQYAINETGPVLIPEEAVQAEKPAM